MPSETSKFLWLGNWLAIDFVNTDIVVEGEPVDLLAEPFSLIEWLAEAGFPQVRTSPLSPGALQRGYQESLSYRTFLRDGMADMAKGATVSAELLERTNELLRHPAAVGRLTEKNGAYRLSQDVHFQTAESFAVPMAISMAKLLTEGDPSRLRKCKNPDCVLYFYDNSKSGTRSWCSLDMCGNKLRMAASRQRRSAPTKQT